jgi:hypothetical protein
MMISRAEGSGRNRAQVVLFLESFSRARPRVLRHAAFACAPRRGLPGRWVLGIAVASLAFLRPIVRQVYSSKSASLPSCSSMRRLPRIEAWRRRAFYH